MAKVIIDDASIEKFTKFITRAQADDMTQSLIRACKLPSIDGVILAQLTLALTNIAFKSAVVPVGERL
jgi:hypothetical protein